MLYMGFEGSANKIGIGILNDYKILSNVRRTYITPPGEGFIPSKTAEHHKSVIFELINESLAEANIKLDEIDVFCYTKGPGMGQCLSVVALITKVIGFYFKKPIIPVNHCIAHIEMGRYVTGAINPTILYVSGGNTQVISYSNKRYKIFGETLDNAVGNCIDKVARILKIPNDPAPGLNIEKYAKLGNTYKELPYVVKGMDVSFSGIISKIKTFSVNDKQDLYDICYSLQETIFAMLVEITERTMAFCNSSEVLIVGGVGCNLRLQEMMEIMANARGGILYATDERYCIDNGIMIAYTGMLMHKSGQTYEKKDLTIAQRFRTDTVQVTWRDD